MNPSASPFQNPSEPIRLTREQLRRVDALAVEQLGLPSIVLMENAAINATGFVVDRLEDLPLAIDMAPRVAILCGSGNNGGDGFAMARQLSCIGVDVSCFALTDPSELSPDALVNRNACVDLGIHVELLLDSDAIDRACHHWRLDALVVDAMLGTGFSGEVRPHLAYAIDTLNELDHPWIISLDIPSGLDTDTGEAAQSCVMASTTVTFATEKIGFSNPAAEQYTGRIVLAEIGVPENWIVRTICQE